MKITLDLFEFKNILAEMAALGVARMRQEEQPAADLISQREAYRQFNQSRVRRWEHDGLLAVHRTGNSKTSKRLYSRTELMALDCAERTRPILAMNALNAARGNHP